MTEDLPALIEEDQPPKHFKVGRPSLWKNKEQAEKAVEDYVNDVLQDNYRRIKRRLSPNPPTITGFCRFAGCHYNTYLKYKKEKPSFLDAIMSLETFITEWHEENVSRVPAYSLGYLKKKMPEFWKNEEPEDGEASIGQVVGNVTINVQKNYGKLEKGKDDE